MRIAGASLDLPAFEALGFAVRVLGEGATWVPPLRAGADGRMSAEGPDWVGRWRWREVQGGFVLEGELVARREIALDRVEVQLGGVTLGGLGWARFYRHGYASWSPSASFEADTTPPRPFARSFAIANHPVDSPWYGREDGLLSSLVGVLSWPDRALLVGWLAQRAGLGEVFMERRSPPTIHAGLAYDGKRLAAGERLALEPLLVRSGLGPGLLDAYAADVAAEHGLPAITAPSPVGWCSWYHFYTAVTAEDMARNAAGLAGWPALGATVLQLDDGYQTAVGDWRSCNTKFPGGLAPVAKQAREAGFQAGLWLAPFMAARRSTLARKHPDWVLRDRRGRAVGCGFNPAWRDWLVGLDLSHPAVQDWLRALFTAFMDDGFDYFKLDFLYAGLRAAARHDPRLSAVEAYRRGLEIVREAIGPDRFLLGCGAPIGPSLGLFDAMRVSADVKEAWYPRFFGLLGKDCGVASLREAARNNLTRAWQHRVWWRNDPDCLLVRDQDTELGLDETRLLVSLWAMTGGLMVLSDDLAAVPPARRALLESILPPSPRGGFSPDLLEASFPRELRMEGQGRALRAAINWGPHPDEHPIDRRDDLHRFDFWTAALVPEAKLWVATHGVRVILETARGALPTLIGTTLHLTALVDGLIRERWVETGAGGALEIEAGPLAASEGELWVGLPEGWALAEGHGLEVRAFDGGVAVMVRQRGPWSMRLPFARRGALAAGSVGV